MHILLSFSQPFFRPFNSSHSFTTVSLSLSHIHTRNNKMWFLWLLLLLLLLRLSLFHTYSSVSKRAPKNVHWYLFITNNNNNNMIKRHLKETNALGLVWDWRTLTALSRIRSVVQSIAAVRIEHSVFYIVSEICIVHSVLHCK